MLFGLPQICDGGNGPLGCWITSIFVMLQPACFPPQTAANCSLLYCDAFLDEFTDDVTKTRAAWDVWRIAQGLMSATVALLAVERLLRYASIRSAEGGGSGGRNSCCSRGAAAARVRQLCCKHRGSVQLIALIHILVLGVVEFVDAFDPSGWCGIFDFAAVDVVLDVASGMCLSLIFVLTYGFFRAMSSNLPAASRGDAIVEQLLGVIRRRCCSCGSCGGAGGGVAALSPGGGRRVGTSSGLSRSHSRNSSTGSSPFEAPLLNEEALTQASRPLWCGAHCCQRCRRARPCQVHAYVWIAQCVMLVAITLLSTVEYATPFTLAYVIAGGVAKTTFLLVVVSVALLLYLYIARRISRSLALLVRDKRRDFERLRVRRKREAARAVVAAAEAKVSCLLYTVTYYANLAHSLTRSP